MKPLTMIAVGIAIIVIDIRIDNVDMVPDVIGWLVCFWALLRLARGHSWYGVGLAGAALGAGASMFALTQPETAPISLLSQVATLLLIFGTSSGLMQAADSVDARVTKMANVLRWLALVLALGSVAIAALVMLGEVTSLVTTVVIVLGFANFVVLIWFVVLLVTNAQKDYAQPPTPVV